MSYLPLENNTREFQLVNSKQIDHVTICGQNPSAGLERVKQKVFY